MEPRHRLFLSMHSFQIKKINTPDLEIVDPNTFLSNCYHSIEGKFENGFVQDLIKLFDLKLFKNSSDTLGGILEESDLNNSERIFDIMINGGAKGLKQYLIDEDGSKEEISDKDIVGLKFFARIWLPSHSNAGYLFVQRYSNISIKPLFDELLKSTFRKHKYGLVGNRTIRTTTKKRQKEFLNRSEVSEIIITTYGSPHNTGGPDITSAVISLKNLKEKKRVGPERVSRILEERGINIDGEYNHKVKYKSEKDGYKEEKTIDEDNIYMLIPNTVIPLNCIDDNNHPKFKAMQEFVSSEIEQIKKEAKSK